MSEGRFAAAVLEFTAAHREDPAGEALGYHRRLSAWVERLAPDAGEALRLAAWCQHLRRWHIARCDYPEGVTGYKQWRSTLARHHGDQAAEILRAAGYDDDVIERVRGLLIKKALRKDPEVQLFEDAICLTFIETQLADFASRHDDEKMLGILRKTWDKMSGAGHAAAAELLPGLPPEVRALVERAIG